MKTESTFSSVNINVAVLITVNYYRSFNAKQVKSALKSEITFQNTSTKAERRAFVVNN